MSDYKTPGVYVKEIPTLPPSVAGVETAIPAFIGYTERADRTNPRDLLLVPTKVSSLLEYNLFFGGPPCPNVVGITVDDLNVLDTAEIDSTYYMYDSLQMFFKNGGGDCYIVSIGLFGTNNAAADYLAGLEKLKKADEPTLILFPDAVKLEDGLYNIQQEALKHCAELQDRFCILDLLEKNSSVPGFDWEQGWKSFRDNIGVNSLHYGAVYTPYLKINLGPNLFYRDIRGKVTRGGVTMDFSQLTNVQEVRNTLISLNNAIDDYDRIQSNVKNQLLSTGILSLKDEYQKRVDTLKESAQSNTPANFKKLFELVYKTAQLINDWAAGNNQGNPVVVALKGDFERKGILIDLQNLIANSLKSTIEQLVAYDKGANTVFPNSQYLLYEGYFWTASQWGAVPAEGITPFDRVTENTEIYQSSGDDKAKRLNALPYITNVFIQINAALSQIITSARLYESNGEQSLFETHSVYKALITSLKKRYSILPPSGAVAGIYAQVDNARGVWKAPANVNLTGVLGLTEQISNKKQEDLNVDPVAGKSINAIRAFPGKGILVWGARTLAGNDNEWRYVSVRRFFIFAEESIKKAIERFVFEPNVQDTWIKVKGAIEHFLTDQWKAGALAGSTPQQAFFVSVGLGQTMTAQDILEGRMIVEVGMAASRPAEFIILKFSHKLQEA